MNESIVNREEVLAAADSLHAEGITPTVVNVRERAGKGAFGDITRYISEWKQDPQRRAISQLPPPPDSVAQGLSQVWTQAWILGQQEVMKERQGFEFSRQDIEREKQEMMGEIYRLETQLESKTMRVEIFDTERLAMREQLDSLRSELAKKQLEIEPSKERWVREKGLLQVELEQLNSEVASQQTLIEQVSVERSKLKEKLTSMTSEIIQLNAEATEVQYQAELVTAEQLLQQEQLNRLQSELTQQDDTKATADAESKQESVHQLQSLNEELATAQVELERSKSAKNESETHLNRLNDELTHEQDIRRELEQGQTGIQTELTSVKSELAHYRQDEIGHSEEMATLQTDVSRHKAALIKEREQRQKIVERYDELEERYLQLDERFEKERSGRLNIEQEMRAVRKYQLQLQTALEEERAGAAELRSGQERDQTPPAEPQKISQNIENSATGKRPFAADQERDLQALTKLFDETGR